ncbi:MAG: 7-cyano-7-deazaguanine synthase QueC [Desulfomicrobium sp.]|nr:7-cyano-7-deazaguanine synthase QueC [Pseudomonadota bacterium]MBU4572255.1 7-cyano-7-deazaguanine synthase QueC [Pseudomonadota bacterium]MBU4594233.1 7-cyano-7-deazaguanine synthase QueC [Pseudomonadota bacterium]MBV1713719.1 7-cyano-7-deazaguanine synthase QueC [Desulfomicrobium sp.]
MMDAVIVLSGGMDSAVLLSHELSKGQRVAALSFDYGSKHNHCELPMAREICLRLGVEHRVVALPFINELFTSSLLRSGEAVPEGAYDADSMKSTVVPFRNGILIAIAVGYAESVGAARVLIGSHSGDHHIYPDCRPEFNAAMNKAARLGTGDAVRVDFPFAAMDKREIGDLGRALGVDFVRTWTCYKGGELHCGICGACDERKFALRHDQGLDPTPYAK